MRPTYETAQDVSRERQIVDTLCHQFGMTAVKLPQFKDIDFALVKGERVWGVVEVKCRNKHYDQMFLSLEKCQNLRRYAASGLQARVIFATPKGIYAKTIGPGSMDGWIGLGGRSDRGDPKDQEMIVYFGDFVVNGIAIQEEKEPMKRVCDSNQRWFA